MASAMSMKCFIFSLYFANVFPVIYISMMECLSGFILAVAIVILKIYHQPEATPMPKILQKLVVKREARSKLRRKGNIICVSEANSEQQSTNVEPSLDHPNNEDIPKPVNNPWHSLAKVLDFYMLVFCTSFVLLSTVLFSIMM